ncbi:TonB-dependent receptor [Polynucleobacter sp. Fuers-14]|uniref:TonB-dependent receptor n=1 Tax=Polynucleobacter sp. Fuers-14 TaxID=1758364 RepID=UPI001C0D19BF|nr:TonB-dependent receptor [Polynucleobacter sp. Fuers-14]MBU3641317.1 TonB-dependent receptor [Polynucleobacter sp. Fuers-14]
MHQRALFKSCVSTQILLVASGAVYAQIAPLPDYDQKLSDVVVSATRSGTPLDQMSLNTTILTKEVLESSPDQTIDQVLKNVPGVFLNDVPYYQKDPTGQSINVRGLGYGRTLVLIDGLPANDAFYGTVQWNLVPMSSIESVEFVRGGVSSLWGNYGMGGVININTKTPKNSGQDVSASYGSFAAGNVAASKDLIVSDAMQMRFSADYFSSEGFQNYATISPGSTSNIKNGMGTDAVKNSNVRLQNYFKPTQDTNGFLRLGYSTMADLSNNYAIAPNLIQTADVAAGSTTNLDVDKKVQVNVYYQATNFYKQTANNLSAAPYKPYVNANYTDPYSTVGASAQYTHDLKAAGIDQYILGVDARNISASNQTNNLATTGAVSSVNYAQGQQNFYGLLGQLKSNATAIPLETTLGARIDSWNSQTPTSYNAGANGVSPLYQAIPNQSKTQLSPSLGLLYKATQNWDLRSAAYQAFHAPSMNNTLRSYGNSVSGYSLANPNLTPETMTGYEVGTDYRWKSGFAQLTAFNNYIQNAIASYRITNANAASATSLCAAAGISGCSASTGGYTNVSYYTNQQNLLSRGIELQYHQDVNAQWALDGGYSYTNTILTWTATTDPINAQVGGVPRNMANAGLTYYPVPRASLTTTVRYVGNSWMSTGSLPVPAYALVGFKANYELTPQASVFASVVNLLNRQYVTFNIASQASAYQAGMPQAITVGARLQF